MSSNILSYPVNKIDESCAMSLSGSENGDSVASHQSSSESPLIIPPSFALALRGRSRFSQEPAPVPQSQPRFNQRGGFNHSHNHGMQNQYHHQPYSQQQSYVAAPPTYVFQAPVAQFPECCFHRSLVDKLEFIEPPAVSDSGVPFIRGPCFRLFIGQIRFETSAAEIRWLLHYLTGVSALKVELRGMGCCLAYFETYEEIQKVCQLRFRLLFDHTGVWFARDEEQMALLQRYVQYYVCTIGKGFRLPKDMMVLEDERFQAFPQMPEHASDRGLPPPALHYQPQM